MPLGSSIKSLEINRTDVWSVSRFGMRGDSLRNLSSPLLMPSQLFHIQLPWQHAVRLHISTLHHCLCRCFRGSTVSILMHECSADATEIKHATATPRHLRKCEHDRCEYIIAHNNAGLERTHAFSWCQTAVHSRHPPPPPPPYNSSCQAERTPLDTCSMLCSDMPPLHHFILRPRGGMGGLSCYRPTDWRRGYRGVSFLQGVAEHPSCGAIRESEGW